MKTTLKYCYLIVFILFSQLVVAQSENQKLIAKFVITKATKNGEDVTPLYIQTGASLIFYTSGNDGLLYLSNFCPNADSQSYGPVYAVKSSSIPKKNKKQKVDISHFNWHYTNTYDNKTGIAKVEMPKIYNPLNITFSITIIPENLDILIYNGYMEGSVDFSAFN